MKELTLKRRLNTYLYRGYPGISSNFENGTKQLEAQLENGVAYKKNVYYTSLDNSRFSFQPEVVNGISDKQPQSC